MGLDDHDIVSFWWRPCEPRKEREGERERENGKERRNREAGCERRASEAKRTTAAGPRWSVADKIGRVRQRGDSKRESEGEKEIKGLGWATW